MAERGGAGLALAGLLCAAATLLGATGCGLARKDPQQRPSETLHPPLTTVEIRSKPSLAPAPEPITTHASPLPAGCHAGFPLAGVFTPQRLRLRSPCLTVSGTVGCVHTDEEDGDTHLDLLLDPAYRKYLTAGNSVWTCGDSDTPRLVVEVIPQHCVPRRDNCADLGHFTDPPIPPEGAHVTITGPWVQDTSHYHGATLWSEIHPAWRIVIG